MRVLKWRLGRKTEDSDSCSDKRGPETQPSGFLAMRCAVHSLGFLSFGRRVAALAWSGLAYETGSCASLAMFLLALLSRLFLVSRLPAENLDRDCPPLLGPPWSSQCISALTTLPTCVESVFPRFAQPSDFSRDPFFRDRTADYVIRRRNICSVQLHSAEMQGREQASCCCAREERQKKREARTQ